MEVEGAAYRLRRWGGAGEPILSIEAEPGSALPSYGSRRRLRERVRPAGSAKIVRFTDAAQLRGVWSWMEREPAGPRVYRECAWDPSHPWAAPARGWPGEQPGGSVDDPSGSPAARRATRAALLGLLRRGGVEPVEIHMECANPGQLVQDIIEGTEDEEMLRSVWRAACRLRVLDPACRSGEWLVGAAEALAPVYLACMARMEAWTADAERSGARTRATRWGDFRAVLAAADDTRRWPTRRRYARALVVARNLRGADPDAAAVAATAARLERWVRCGSTAGPGAPLAPLMLRAGPVVTGAMMARGMRACEPPGGWGEAAEAAQRAGEQLRRAWLREGAAEAAVAAAARGIRERLNGLASASTPSPEGVDPWVEYGDVLGAGGFHLIHGGPR